MFGNECPGTCQGESPGGLTRKCLECPETCQGKSPGGLTGECLGNVRRGTLRENVRIPIIYYVNRVHDTRKIMQKSTERDLKNKKAYQGRRSVAKTGGVQMRTPARYA